MRVGKGEKGPARYSISKDVIQIFNKMFTTPLHQSLAGQARAYPYDFFIMDFFIIIFFNEFFLYTALYINVFFILPIMSKYRQKLKLQQLFAGLGFGQPTSMIL